MPKLTFLITPVITVFIGLLSAAPALALAARTFVSVAGSDSNNCANVATPCRHFAAAYAATAPNGEIHVLDPANYGSLTITGPVSIEGHGWAAISPVSGSAAITINANTGDKINIIGVVLDGIGTANPFTSGIQFNSGGSLHVQDSIIRNFTQDGIAFAPNSSTLHQISVSNTLVSDNGANGIDIVPQNLGTTNGILDHVQIVNNGGFGLSVASDTQSTNVTISNSVSANNGGSGIIAFSNNATPINVMVRNTSVANNLDNGLEADNPGATVSVTQSTITGNNAGWGIVSGGLVLSYADNNIDSNGSANIEPPSPLSYK